MNVLGWTREEAVGRANGARPVARAWRLCDVRDAAYGTLLREPRRALHARIAETIEDDFAEIAENQPELLARHCTEAGLKATSACSWIGNFSPPHVRVSPNLFSLA